MRALLAFVVLAAALAPPAQADAEQRHASFLVYTSPAPTAGTTRFDGLSTVQPGASTGSSFNRMQAALTARASTGDPLEASLEVARTDAGIQARASFRGDGELPPLAFSFALAQDDGKHRFVVRGATTTNGTLDLAGTWTATTGFPTPPSAGQLSLVAWASATAPSGRYQEGEVLQSIAWVEGQDGPTRQTRKAVLVEHHTAPDCAPCAAPDEALLLLATQSGFPLEAQEPASYLVAPGWRAVAGALMGLGLGLFLWRPRP